jgi:hypothetical protein
MKARSPKSFLKRFFIEQTRRALRTSVSNRDQPAIQLRSSIPTFVMGTVSDFGGAEKSRFRRVLVSLVGPAYATKHEITGRN